MAVLTGKSADITFATGYVLHCNSWTIELTLDVFEDTELGNTWRTLIGGINDWSGSYDCALDETGLAAIGDIGVGEAAANAVFTYGSTATITGSIAITGSTLTSSTSGVNTITFTFTGSGKPVFA
jgi:hypothetical protein